MDALGFQTLDAENEEAEEESEWFGEEGDC